MNTPKAVLINCSNLHHGGGVGVATSFISGLANSNVVDLRFSLLISSQVEQNLRQIGIDLSGFESVCIENVYGLSSIWSHLGQFMKRFDLTFTIFGPLYLFRMPGCCNLVGMAQPHVANPRLSFQIHGRGFKAMGEKLGNIARGYFFSRSDHLVVELESVRELLLQQGLFQSAQISVVHSAVDAIFFDPDRWVPLNYEFPNSNKIKLGVISKNYPHKNLKIFPHVKKCLKKHFGIEVEIYVTLSSEEWLACDAEFRREVVNLGSLSLAQCPMFYGEMDGVLFPTLMECFSAVPIEAAALKRPLFVSNRAFIREVTGRYAEFFDPLDAFSIANTIADFFALPQEEREHRCNKLYQYTQRFHSSLSRTSGYLSVIRSLLI